MSRSCCLLLCCLLPPLLLLGAGCGGSRTLTDPVTGRGLADEAGAPPFDLEVFAARQSDSLGSALALEVFVRLPREALVFTQVADSAFRGVYEVAVRVVEADGRRFVTSTLHRDTVWVATFAATQAGRAVVQALQLPVPGGTTYRAEVTLRDAATDRTALRQQQITVPAAVPTTMSLGRIRLEGRTAPGHYAPLVSRALPEGTDTLRATVTLDHPPPAGVRLTMRLLHLPRDTSVAEVPYGLTPSYASLRYRGVRYDAADTLQVSRRTVPGGTAAAAVTVDFMLPALAPGVYRVGVAAEGGDGPDEQVRDLVVLQPNFPRLTTLDDLIGALVYLNSKREQQALEAPGTPAERQQRFDAFWGKLIPNRQEAANVLKHYYSRVEEANRRYTAHKAGWQTDRGMVYIVLGPPLYIEDRFDRQTWFYAYDDRDPVNAYVFERARFGDAAQVFDHYVLQRTMAYRTSWQRAVRRWRAGQVL